MKAEIKKYFSLARLNKPWGVVLLAWPTLSALALVKASVTLWVVFLLGIVLTRSAGCVINDYADQWLDGQVSRTKDRPLVQGAISANAAICLFVSLMLLASLLLFFLPMRAKLLAVVASAMIVAYPYMKRFFLAPQLFLGLTFSLGIPMAYISVGKHMGVQGWGLFGLSVFWVVIYDTVYALSDRPDDEKLGVYSLAITLGAYVENFILYGYFMLWILWAFWGMTLSINGWFMLSWLVLGHNLYQQYMLVKKKAFFKAFLANQQAGCLVLLGIIGSMGW